MKNAIVGVKALIVLTAVTVHVPMILILLTQVVIVPPILLIVNLVLTLLLLLPPIHAQIGMIADGDVVDLGLDSEIGLPIVAIVAHQSVALQQARVHS